MFSESTIDNLFLYFVLFSSVKDCLESFEKRQIELEGPQLYAILLLSYVLYTNSFPNCNVFVLNVMRMVWLLE